MVTTLHMTWPALNSSVSPVTHAPTVFGQSNVTAVFFFFHYAFVNIASSDSNPFHLEAVNTRPRLPLAFNTGLQAQGIYSSFPQLGSVPPCVCFSRDLNPFTHRGSTPHCIRVVSFAVCICYQTVDSRQATSSTPKYLTSSHSALEQNRHSMCFFGFLGNRIYKHLEKC